MNTQQSEFIIILSQIGKHQQELKTFRRVPPTHLTREIKASNIE